MYIYVVRQLRLKFHLLPKREGFLICAVLKLWDSRLFVANSLARYCGLVRGPRVEKKKSDMPDFCRSQWPRGLRRRSAAARLLRLWVRIPPAG